MGRGARHQRARLLTRTGQCVLDHGDHARFDRKLRGCEQGASG